MDPELCCQTNVEFWIDIIDDEKPSEFWGVYTMIERVDRKFTGNRFGQDSKDGNLYKASHAQRGPIDLKYYGDSIVDYPLKNGQYAYGKENNLDSPDYSDIVKLCYVIDGTEYSSPDDFAEALEKVFNVDAFLRYMAVITLTMNWDSYPYTGNNFFLFNNFETGKFEWILWDINWGGNVNAPLFDKVFEVQKYRLQFCAYLDLLMRQFFNYDTIYQKTKYYHEMIAPYVSQADVNMHLNISLSAPGKITIDQVKQALKPFCSKLKLLRFDENDKMLEFSFIVEFKTLNDLNSARDALVKLSGGINITFLDNKGIW